MRAVVDEDDERLSPAEPAQWPSSTATGRVGLWLGRRA
jgi:hypothetical protein